MKKISKKTAFPVLKLMMLTLILGVTFTFSTNYTYANDGDENCEPKQMQGGIYNMKNRFLARGCKLKCGYFCDTDISIPDITIKPA